jgi:hypothetical protein
MDKADLLSQFQAKVDEFARYQAFIDKARAQADRFAPEVVAKVISSNESKAMVVVEDLIPLTGDVVDVIEALRADRAGIESATADSTLRMQELELRQAIGELDDDAFAQESADLRVALDQAQERIAAIDTEAESFSAALERWNVLGVAAGVLNSPVTPAEPAVLPEPEPDLEPELAADPIDTALDEAMGEVEAIAVDEAYEVDGDGDGIGDIVEIHVDDEIGDDLAMEVEEDDFGVHVESVAVSDDVSSVFPDGDDDDSDEPSVDDSEDGETRNEPVLMSDDVLPAEDSGLDILGDDEPLELDGVDSVNDIKPRRAVLLQSESTPDEQVHPITKDVLSIGRGRDNDVQVRNDSKVSRYHCKVYRRGPNYYIEDNKSANGSLVNGELITERRLFGGEEIIVGETFFRFRIMD